MLEKLSSVGASKRKKMLLKAPTQLFSVIKAICKLFMSGHLQSTSNKQQNIIKKLSTGKLATIKRTAQQKGGAIGSIIAAALPFLTPLIAKLFK